MYKLQIVIYSALLLLITACTGSTALVRPCCYQGEVVLSHLKDIEFSMEGGGTNTFREVFRDFQLDDSELLGILPFEEAAFSDVIYETADRILRAYDANEDGHIEEPELTVLYLIEIARGLGFKVEGMARPQSRAITTSPAEVSGLLNFISHNKAGLNATARQLFQELEWVGEDVRTPDGGEFEKSPR